MICGTARLREIERSGPGVGFQIDVPVFVIQTLDK
jgi:hypothetical protein